MKHFTLTELTHSATAETAHIDNTPPPEAVAALTRLVDAVLDPLREAWGHPIYVTSGYRCPQLNTLVHGATHSQHMKGEAADVTGGSIAANRNLLRLIKQLKLPVDQVIDEHRGGWLHISHGPRHRRQFLATH